MGIPLKRSTHRIRYNFSPLVNSIMPHSLVILSRTFNKQRIGACTGFDILFRTLFAAFKRIFNQQAIECMSISGLAVLITAF